MDPSFPTLGICCEDQLTTDKVGTQGEMGVFVALGEFYGQLQGTRRERCFWRGRRMDETREMGLSAVRGAELLRWLSAVGAGLSPSLLEMRPSPIVA